MAATEGQMPVRLFTFITPQGGPMSACAVLRQLDQVRKNQSHDHCPRQKQHVYWAASKVLGGPSFCAWSLFGKNLFGKKRCDM